MATVANNDAEGSGSRARDGAAPVTTIPDAPRGRRAAGALASQPAGVYRTPAVPKELAEDVLQLDGHTIRDLEVFEADPGGKSLYRHINFCRTEGGAAAQR